MNFIHLTPPSPYQDMGYPRFGAVGALLLARLCISTPMPLDGPELRLFGIVLLAEICEDLCSWDIWDGDGWRWENLQNPKAKTQQN